VNLPQTRRRQRNVLEPTERGGEPVLPAVGTVGQFPGPVAGEGRDAVLQTGEGRDPFGGEEVLAAGEDLAYFDVEWSEAEEAVGEVVAGFLEEGFGLEGAGGVGAGEVGEGFGEECGGG